MDTQRIIITLSANDIALSYVKGEGPRLPEKFPGGRWPMPLDSFGYSEASYPMLKIGKGVDERVRALYDEGILTDDDGEAGFKDNLEVLLLTENDLTDIDIANAKADLERWGFRKLQTIHPDVAIAELYCNDNDYKGLVIASSNGKNMSISLLLREAPDGFRRINLDGMAVDSRTEAVAEKIWDLVKDNTLGLTYSSEAPILRKVAEDFLKTTDVELEGPVRLSDGQPYEFFLTRSSLKNLTQKDNSLKARFTDILLDNDMSDRSGLALILRNEAVGNQFVKEMITEAFAKIEEEKDSFKEAVAKYIAGKDWDSLNEKISIKDKVKPGPGGDRPGADKEKKVKEKEKPQPGKPVSKKLIPVNISAEVVKTGGGFLGLFNKKAVLKIKIDIPDRTDLPWKSVLCVQENPLSVIERKYVVKEYPREDRPPFRLDVDLPLKSSPKAKSLYIYFYPDPDEPVGINNVYEFDEVIVNLD